MIHTLFNPSADSRETRIIYLLGNPNVGKSTVFNALTGLRQHTGNWSGKTVDAAYGVFTYASVVVYPASVIITLGSGAPFAVYISLRA